MTNRVATVEPILRAAGQKRNSERSFDALYKLAVEHSWLSKRSHVNLRFDAIVTEKEPIVLIGLVREDDLGGEPRSISISTEQEREVEWQLRALYRVALQSEKYVRGNKIRLVISCLADDYVCKFDIKYDSDLDWLECDNQFRGQHLALSLEEESCIEGWEGLPVDFFRAWVN